MGDWSRNASVGRNDREVVVLLSNREAGGVWLLGNERLRSGCLVVFVIILTFKGPWICSGATQCASCRKCLVLALFLFLVAKRLGQERKEWRGRFALPFPLVLVCWELQVGVSPPIRFMELL